MQGVIIAWIMSQQQSVSHGQIYLVYMLLHTEIEAEDEKRYLDKSQYTDTGPTSLKNVPTTADVQ